MDSTPATQYIWYKEKDMQQLLPVNLSTPPINEYDR